MFYPRQKIVNESLEHKKSLLSLKEVDPNFYKYLEENDKELLNFDMSESDDEDDNDIQGLHQPPQKLEVCIFDTIRILN